MCRRSTPIVALLQLSLCQRLPPPFGLIGHSKNGNRYAPMAWLETPDEFRGNIESRYIPSVSSPPLAHPAHPAKV